MGGVRAILPGVDRRAVIGMVHVGALPGTVHNQAGLETIVRDAVAEAKLLADGGFNAVMIENTHDRPYLLGEVGPEIVAGMTAVGVAVRQAVGIPVGVQVLAGANRQALAVAQACGASFVRAEGFVFAHVADEGLMGRADAGDLLRYRRRIGADQVAVWADVKKKHASHALTGDVDLAQTARAAEFFAADAVIVTGTVTGEPAAPQDVQAARQAVGIPVIIGSGITADNLRDYWAGAHAFIVGSSIKRDGLWSNPPDPDRVQRLMRAVAALPA